MAETSPESPKPPKKKLKIHIPRRLRNIRHKRSGTASSTVNRRRYLYWLLDRQGGKTTTTSTSTPTVSDQSVKPVQPAANEAEGVAVAMLTSPVQRGQDASITINTNAGSLCNILVTYNKVVSKVDGLGPAMADDFGSVGWTWTVAENTPIGTWPIKVTCVYHGRSGVVDTNLQVTN